MKKLIHVSLFFLLFTLLTDAFPQKSPDQSQVKSLKDLFWMEGIWKGLSGNSPFFEGYEIENDSLMIIKYYSGPDLSKVAALGSLFMENDNIYHTYKRSKWKLASRSGNTWSFEPVENASNHFQWVFVDPDSWRAEITSRGQATNYLMQRVK